MTGFAIAPRRCPPAALATALLALAIHAATASALTLLPLDLGALTSGAGRIFVGHVLDVASGRDANGLPAVWTTFRVDEPLKGAPAQHVTVKQLGIAFGGGGAAVAPHPGLPAYRRGEEVLLFVHPESTLGFTSPVGLAQGCFRIRERNGGRVAENDLGNRNLLPASDASGRSAGGPAAEADPEPRALPLASLLTEVRTLLATSP